MTAQATAVEARRRAFEDGIGLVPPWYCALLLVA